MKPKKQPEPDSSPGIIRMGEWLKLIGEVHRMEIPEGFYSHAEYQASIGGKETRTRKILKLLVKKRLAVMRVFTSRSSGRSVPHWRINADVLASLKSGKGIPIKG